MLRHNPLHKCVEAAIDLHELLHGVVGQEPEEGDEVGRVSAAHHLSELIAHVDQAEQLGVVVAVAPAEAHATDDVGHRHHDVAEGVEAAAVVHHRPELLHQVQTLLADVLLQDAGVGWVLALQRGEGAQGAHGQLASGAPHAGLVGAEGQAFTVVDELETVEIRPAGKVLALLDECLSHHLVAAEDHHGPHTDLDLEHVAEALGHGAEAQVRKATKLQNVPDDGEGPRTWKLAQTFRDFCAELQQQVHHTHCCHGHKALGDRHGPHQRQNQQCHG